MSIKMKCGHNADKTDREGNPFCSRCIEIVSDATIPAPVNHSLIHRKAKCKICRKEEISDIDLPFFDAHPLLSYDSYYCGCRGW